MSVAVESVPEVWCDFCGRAGHASEECDNRRAIEKHRAPTFAPSLPSLCSCRGCWPRVIEGEPQRVILGVLDQNPGVAPRVSPLAPTGHGMRYCSGCGYPGHNIRSCRKRHT